MSCPHRAVTFLSEFIFESAEDAMYFQSDLVAAISDAVHEFAVCFPGLTAGSIFPEVVFMRVARLRRLFQDMREAVVAAAEIECCRQVVRKYREFEISVQLLNPELNRILSTQGSDSQTRIILDPWVLRELVRVCDQTRRPGGCAA